MSLSESDAVQNERISKIEERMLMMEQAVLEMRGMAKTIKLVVIALAASFGLDVHGML
jgi:hypothetical protein